MSEFYYAFNAIVLPLFFHRTMKRHLLSRSQRNLSPINEQY